MSEGTVGATVKQLRTAQEMSQDELGALLGLKRDQISKAENGIRRFDVAELALIAERFHTTVARLVGRPESGTLLLAARIAEDAKEGGVHEVRLRARQLLELDHLLGEIGFRREKTISADGALLIAEARALAPAASKKQANADGAALALRTRQLLGLGTAPLSSIADLAERHFGVDVECSELGIGVSGVCVHTDSVAMIMANTALSLGHLRFTLAHELAHHLLGDPREVVVEDGFGGSSATERRANAFAAHLLMPRDEVRRILGERPVSDELLGELMQYFLVSLSCLVSHLADVSLIPFDSQTEWRKRPARWLLSQYGDPGQPNPAAEGLGLRAPARLVASARDAQRAGRIGTTIVAALLVPP